MLIPDVFSGPYRINMRFILFLISTVLFSCAVLAARSDKNGLLMVIALYCLVAYWLLGKDSSVAISSGSLKFWIGFKITLITTAYSIFNYFALKKAMNFELQTMFIGVLWFFISSGLLYTNCKKLIRSTNSSFQ